MTAFDTTDADVDAFIRQRAPHSETRLNFFT